MNLYRLGVCLKCRGDLAYDDGDWICLQCGTYYYTGLYPETRPDSSGARLLRVAGAGIPDDRDADGRLAPAAD